MMCKALQRVLPSLLVAAGLFAGASTAQAVEITITCGPSGSTSLGR